VGANVTLAVARGAREATARCPRLDDMMRVDKQGSKRKQNSRKRTGGKSKSMVDRENTPKKKRKSAE